MKVVSKQNIKKQAGFTLIELVVVIVILGILAATAAPKFIDLTGDARLSVMKGVQGSINSAVSLAHSKALVAGETGATGEIEIGGTYYALVNGYPASAHAGSGAGTTGNGLSLVALIDLDDDAITFTDASPAVITHTAASVDANCRITYTNAANVNTPPEVNDDNLTDCQ